MRNSLLKNLPDCTRHRAITSTYTFIMIMLTLMKTIYVFIIFVNIIIQVNLFKSPQLVIIRVIKTYQSDQRKGRYF